MTEIIFSIAVSVDTSQISEDEVFEILQDRITQAVNELPSVVLIDFSQSARYGG